MPARGQVTYTPDELEQLIDSYFARCEGDKVERIMGKRSVMVPRPTSWGGLALHIGVDVRTLDRWRNGDYHPQAADPATGAMVDDIEAQQRVCLTLARARQRIIEDTYTGAILGQYNDRVALARLAVMGESAKQEIDQTVTMRAAWVGVDPADAERYSK